MTVAVVVPFRGGCPYRERAWTYVQRLYAERHPDSQVIEALAPDGQWCKGAAVWPAIEASDADIIAVADADVWTDGLPDAIKALDEGAPFALPHLKVHRLTEEATAGVLAGADWLDQPLAQRPYQGFIGGGIVVAPRETLLDIPIDPRFTGWGQEDESWGLALWTLAGEPWRGTADLVHLFHPPQERASRRKGSRKSWALRSRYFGARRNPAAMRALLEEARCHSTA